MIDLTNKTIYLTAGPARNGKDTIADALAAVTGLTSSAVSTEIYKNMATDIAASMIWDHNHRALQGAGRVFGVKESMAQREWLAQQIEAALKGIQKDVPDSLVGLRPYLISEGNYRTQTDPTFWLRRLLERGVSIIPGIRRLAEFEGILRDIKESGGKAVTIWVERPDCQNPVKEDNLELHPSRQNFTHCIAVAEGGHEKIRTAAEIIKALKGEEGNIAVSAPNTFSTYERGHEVLECYGVRKIYNV